MGNRRWKMTLFLILRHFRYILSFLFLIKELANESHSSQLGEEDSVYISFS